MSGEFIKVNSIALSAVIRAELKRNGIIPQYTDVAGFQKFTREELASIKRIKLENNNFGDISALEYCTNLRDLTISSINPKNVPTNFSSEAYYSYRSKQAMIKDFSVISKLQSLQFLTILNDENLEFLDLTGLTNLSSLILRGNHKLKTVKGLETLAHLLELELVNNGINHSFDLKRMLGNELNEVTLDFDLYPLVKEAFPNIGSEMIEYLKQGIKCFWSENLSDIRTNQISTMRMEKMNKRATEIINSIIGPDYSDIEKVSAIYAYIIKTVKYDEEALRASKGEENETLKKARENLGELTSTILDRKQSSFNAILEQKAVCEGYTNMMHYLLKMVGINSVTVHCSSNQNRKVVGQDSNHSVIRVEINGEWYYFDPTWDAEQSNLKNFFKTKEEINTNHTLSMSEVEIGVPETKPYTNAQLTTILKRVISDRDSRKNEFQNALKMIEQNNKNRTAQGYLEEYSAKLQYLQTEYQKVIGQIEELMKKQSKEEEEQILLNQLLAQRDELNRQIEPILTSKNAFESAALEQIEQQQRIKVEQIEKLLGIQITSAAGYIYDPNLKVPRIILKNIDSLLNEQESIKKQLEERFHLGEIDVKTYQTMIDVINRKYKKMIMQVQPATTNNFNLPLNHNVIEPLDREHFMKDSTVKRTDFDELRRKVLEEDYQEYLKHSVAEKRMTFEEWIRHQLEEEEKVEPIEGPKRVM